MKKITGLVHDSPPMTAFAQSKLRLLYFENLQCQIYFLLEVNGQHRNGNKSSEVDLKNNFRVNYFPKQFNHKHLTALQKIRCVNQPPVVLNV